MRIAQTYLTSLQGRIFKLLPMREAYDNGVDNHLNEYIENLCDNLDGAFKCYPEFSSYREMSEIQSNLWSLKTNADMKFVKWRAVILRSTRLVQAMLTRYYGE